MSARAELIEDRGEAAASSEFFRSRPFLDAEAATHTLRIAGDSFDLVAPLIVRQIPGTTEKDAISPYGYPGLSEREDRGYPRRSNSGEAPSEVPPILDPSAIDWSKTGLVSVFLRHTLGQSPLAGASERNIVQIADPGLPVRSRATDRRQIRRNLEAGYSLELIPGEETTLEQRAGFLAAYEQTMRRANARARYFFSAAYFERILESKLTTLALALAPDGEPAAASIAARSDGFIHYYLSGTADRYLRDSPMKNVVAALVELATEEGLPLNLGGGISPGDRLEEFKRGFANREEPWRTSEIVCDQAAYERLSAGLDAGGFFPAYRLSG